MWPWRKRAGARRDPASDERGAVCEERLADIEGDLACCTADDVERFELLEREGDRVRASLDRDRELPVRRGGTGLAPALRDALDEGEHPLD